MSCQLNSGCRVSNNQVADTLSRRYKRNYLLLTTFLPLRSFIIGSLTFNSFTRTYSILAAVFLYRSPPHCFLCSSIKWFDSYFWKSPSRGLLSSVLKHQQLFYCCSSHTRFAAWRSGGPACRQAGFGAQKFKRITAFDSTTKLSYEACLPTGRHCTRHYAKPLLAVGLLSPVLANHCQYYVSLSLSLRVVRLRIFYFQKGRRFFLIQFYLGGKGGSFFASFGLCLGLCGL